MTHLCGVLRAFRQMDAEEAVWVLATEDICFKNTILSYFFRLGKCIPVRRGAGIYQENMKEALNVLNAGGWLSVTFQGAVAYISRRKSVAGECAFGRLKWGTASLIVRTAVPPIVLPVVHSGFEKVMPEKYLFGQRPPLPLCKKEISIVVGDPIDLDLPMLRQAAKSLAQGSSFRSLGWPQMSPDGLGEAAQRWLYSKISDQIFGAAEKMKTILSI